MAERLVILGVVVLALGAVWLLVSWRSMRIRRHSAADLLNGDRGRRPLVLAFSTPDCVPCRTAQKPALAELTRRYPQVDVREVDASVRPDLARRFGLFAVPSSVVISSEGRVLAINHGLAGWQRLVRQLGLDGQDR